MKLSAILCLCLLISGCKTASSPTPPLAPGAINQFDQTSYAAILVAQASYNSLLASYKANPTTLASLKAPLDAAASAINLAETAWKTYHADASNPAISASQLQTDQESLTNNLNAAQTSLAAVKP